MLYSVHLSSCFVDSDLSCLAGCYIKHFICGVATIIGLERLEKVMIIDAAGRKCK